MNTATLAAKWLNLAENEYHCDRDSAAKKIETIANTGGLSDLSGFVDMYSTQANKLSTIRANGVILFRCG